MPLRRSLVTVGRWFQPHNANFDPAMATASTTTTPPSVYNNTSTPKNGLTSNGTKETIPKPTNGNKDTIPKSLNHVNFGAKNEDDLQDRKKKYLTAKYGQHQMNLIKKRLRVEMWMYEQLALLYDTNDSSDLEIDLDELLDLEDETRREKWLREKVIDAKRSPKEVDQFVVDLLERAKTL